jgi:predicted membrane-bound spermidine synthase
VTPSPEASGTTATPSSGGTPTTTPRLHGFRRAGLFFLAFASGFFVLTIEIAGARLIAPVYGLSAVPWTAVIGVILAALAVGSHLGGRLADGGRVPLAAVLTVAGLAAGLPLLGGPVPWLARQGLGFIGGAVATSAVLFAPAVLCLGAVVPYLVRADTESLGSIGRRAGDVSAATTAGSIAGSFVTGFLLLPAFPLPVLMGLTAAALLLLAALSGWILRADAPTPVLGLGAVVLAGLGLAAGRPAPEVLFRTQTLHASVQVTERVWADGRRVRELWQNGGSSSAEYVDTGRPAHRYALLSLDLLGPRLPRLERMLVLGGAALTLPVALVRAAPGLEVDVVEIDPVVTELARSYFAFGESPRPGISVVHDDARAFLRRSGEVWDVVYLDVFDHFLTVPWTLVTREALRSMEARLAPDGLLMANVLTPLEGPGAGFLDRLLATAGEVFGAVRAYPADPEVAPGAVQNVVVVAARRGAELPSDPPVPALEWGGQGPPLTDDWAPVEYLQGRLFLEGVRWW